MAASACRRYCQLTATLLPIGLAQCFNQQPLKDLSHAPAHALPRLNFSSPLPLIFHSTFSLLQQWRQTFFPNGHTIAPCTIPTNTHLYHARPNSSFPPSPEWFAFDPAMAYSILDQARDSHLLTFRTTKDVMCIYFDGTSAALMDDGSMDSQMLLIHNNSANVPDNVRFGRPPGSPPYGYHPPYGPRGNWSHFNPLQAEYDRATGLCDFIREKDLGGSGWGYEGVVRMNAAFEVIWCNFSSPSARLVSWLNVSSSAYQGHDDSQLFLTVDSHASEDENSPPVPPRPGRPRGRWPGMNLPFQKRSAFEWFRAAANVYGFVGGVPGRGEARVKMDSCGLFSFYDPSLQHQSHARVLQERDALNLTQDGFWTAPGNNNDREVGLQKLVRRRRYQRAMNVSKSDGLVMRGEVESGLRRALMNEKSTCSGIDWVSITQQVVMDHSSSLYEFRTLLSNDTNLANSSTARRWLSHIRGAAHQVAMPFYEYPPYTRPTLKDSFSLTAPQSRAALARCANQHAPFSNQHLSRSETLTYESIFSVLTAICNTTIPLFLDIEPLWLPHFNNLTASPAELPKSLQHEIRHTITYHLQRIEELMAWLGWAEQWTSCSPGCSVGQVCAIPIWPVMGIGHFSGGQWRYRDPEEAEEALFHGKCVDAEHLDGENVW